MAGKERFPAIATPRSLPSQHRDVQVAVQNIKERLEALEAAHDALEKTANQGIFALKESISGTTTPPATTTTQYIAGASLTLPCAVIFQSKTNVVPADPTLPAQAFGCFGVAVSAAAGVGTVAPGQPVQVAGAGQVISLSATLTAFQPVFCAPNGQLTQTPPSGPAVIQVGVALPGQLMLVAPGPTIISGAMIDGPAVDNFLATTGTIWQFNGVTIAARRIADFVSAAGFTMTVTDDPGNNRVVITFGASSNPGSTQLVEDGWLWDDLDAAEDWESWADDSVANSSAVTPSAVLSVEDAWLDPDDVVDDWDSYLQEQLGRNLPSLILNVEDAWDWTFDDTVEEWDGWQFESFANASTVVGSAFLCVEDGWVDPDDTHDDTMDVVLSSTAGWNQNG